jgi:hypothetical protein
MMLWELLDTTAEHPPFEKGPSFVGLELGEEFRVITDEKAQVIRVRTLDTALSVLHDELRADPQADVRLVFRGKVLCVSVVNELGRPWGRNVPRLVEELRLAVTHFSMGEGWPAVIYGQQVLVQRMGLNRNLRTDSGKSQWTL